MSQNWHHSAIGQSHKRMKFSVIFFAQSFLVHLLYCICVRLQGTKQNAYLLLQYNFLFTHTHDKDNAHRYNVAECFPDAPSICTMWGLSYHRIKKPVDIVKVSLIALNANVLVRYDICWICVHNKRAPLFVNVHYVRASRFHYARYGC